MHLLYIYGINELISLYTLILFNRGGWPSGYHAVYGDIMEITISGLKITYQQSGAGDDLLLLHGWGASSAVMAPMQQRFAASARVTNVDLPGFGASERPQHAWSVYDYADFVEELIQALGLRSPVILGHSFGGRLAIILGSRGVGSRLILTDAAGILPRRGAAYYLRVYSYKAVKQLLRLPGIRRYRERVLDLWRKSNPSSDYNQAQGVMREIFVKCVNEDLQPLLQQIKQPVLLIWGADDTATPLSDGRLMEQLIPDAGLVVFEHCGHYSFLDDPPRFYAVVEYFLTHPVADASDN